MLRVAVLLSLALSGASALCQSTSSALPVPADATAHCVPATAGLSSASSFIASPQAAARTEGASEAAATNDEAVTATSQTVVATAQTPARPAHLSELFGNSRHAHLLEERMQPYESTVEPQGGASLQPMEAASSDGARPFRFGSDFIVLPPPPYTKRVAIALPDGVWVNYWTGSQVLGGQTVSLEVAGAYPMWVRGGSVIPMRMDESSSRQATTIHGNGSSCGSRCLFDLLPAYSDEAPRVEKDADGRVLTRDDHSFRIEGAATHAIVRWRFTQVADARVNGVPVAVLSSPEGFYAAFEHTGTSTVEWTVRSRLRSGRPAISPQP